MTSLSICQDALLLGWCSNANTSTGIATENFSSQLVYNINVMMNFKSSSCCCCDNELATACNMVMQYYPYSCSYTWEVPAAGSFVIQLYIGMRSKFIP